MLDSADVRESHLDSTGPFQQSMIFDIGKRNIEASMASPHCRVIGEEHGFRRIYREITGEVPTRGTRYPMPTLQPR